MLPITQTLFVYSSEVSEPTEKVTQNLYGLCQAECCMPFDIAFPEEQMTEPIRRILVPDF